LSKSCLEAIALALKKMDMQVMQKRKSHKIFFFTLLLNQAIKEGMIIDKKGQFG